MYAVQNAFMQNASVQNYCSHPSSHSLLSTGLLGTATNLTDFNRYL